MPCYDGGQRDEDERQVRQDAHEMKAILCGLLTVLDRKSQTDNVLDLVDWKEVGVSRKKVHGWWMAHRAEDEMRLAKEADTKRKKLVKEQALKKLTDEERKILGV